MPFVIARWSYIYLWAPRSALSLITPPSQVVNRPGGFGHADDSGKTTPRRRAAPVSMVSLAVWPGSESERECRLTPGRDLACNVNLLRTLRCLTRRISPTDATFPSTSNRSTFRPVH
ncbi:MAG: hypothetical protein Ct9H300mP32_0890 [Verrucomicrobiota bacterium]|nr:MAG: hypothetical protein Ct9H300mP32_0890 [Verrucomicrobiota bacterium]